MCKLLKIGLLAFFGLTTVAVAQREESKWGDLSGSFKFIGEIPEPLFHSVEADKEVIGPKVRDESLVINEKNKGIANIVVFLLQNEKQELAVHPSYNKDAEAKVELLMEKGRFSPHVMLLRTTQTMHQRNVGKVRYHARIQFAKNVPS